MQGKYIELAEAIAAVRATLANAGQSMAGSDLQFEVGPVELEFAVELQQNADSAAGVRVMVMTGGIGQEAGRGTVHRIKLTITPVNRSGRPVLISDVDV